MIKGGYKLINLNGNTTVCDGMYEAIKNANGKRLILSGLVYNGITYNELPVNFKADGTQYTGVVTINNGGIKFIVIGVDSTDALTFTLKEAGGGLPEMTSENLGQYLRVDLVESESGSDIKAVWANIPSTVTIVPDTIKDTYGAGDEVNLHMILADVLDITSQATITYNVSEEQSALVSVSGNTITVNSKPEGYEAGTEYPVTITGTVTPISGMEEFTVDVDTVLVVMYEE